MNPVPAASVAPRKKSKTLWVVLISVIVIAVLGAGVYFKRKNSSAIVTVTTEKAVIKTITQIVSATG